MDRRGGLKFKEKKFERVSREGNSRSAGDRRILTGFHKDKEVGKPLLIHTKGESDIWVCGFG